MLSQSELQQNLTPVLEEIGLTEYEKKVYLLSLSLGPMPISAFAKHLEISRPNVYKVILGLEKHGLAQFSERTTRSRTFMVESPNVLLRILNDKRKNLERIDKNILPILPDLLTLYQQGELPTSIRMFDTKDGWIEAYYDILNETKGTYLFFGNVERFAAFAPTAQAAWTNERVKRGIRGLLLTLPSKLAEEKISQDKDELRETRILRVDSPFETSFLLFGKKAILWQPRAPLAVLIEDEYISQMLRSMFMALWNVSK